MPTFKVLVGNQREDKTFAVSIQITHLRSKKYISTGHYVDKGQLKSVGKDKYILKDQYVIKKCNDTIVKYRDKLLKLPNLNSLTVSQVKDYLITDGDKTYIDFISFGRSFADSQFESTGNNTKIILNRLVDFLDHGSIDINNITLTMLNQLVEYLRRPHTIKQFGKPVKSKAIGDATIAAYMGKLKQIYTAAEDHYNKEELGIIPIPYNPFRRFKMPKPSLPKKRNLELDTVKAIRDSEDKLKAIQFGRDIFMLTFYLVGINAKDLFNAAEIKKGRLIYHRAKTVSRKQEKALVSIKVEQEVMQLIEKYKDHTGKRIFNFYHKYKKVRDFNLAVNRGLALLAEKLGIDKVTTYYARHSWATIARNVCKVSKDDIGFSLNHSDGSNKTTDLYIEEDFSIVDDANRKVLDTLL